MFYYCFVIALFLRHHPEVRCINYVKRFEFTGYVDDRKTNIFLFDSPKDKSLTDFCVFQQKVLKSRGSRYLKMNKSFIDAYKVFMDNPFRFMIDNLFEGEDLYDLIEQQRVFSAEYDNFFGGEKLLYKYKQLTKYDMEKKPDDDPNKYVRELLSGKLTFTNPDRFNDPFDCDCELPRSLKKYYVELVYDLIKQFNKGTDVDSINKREVEHELNRYWDKSSISEDSLIDYLFTVVRDLCSVDEVESIAQKLEFSILELENIKSFFRVLCVTNNPRDILMWGYYCNGGEGVSVEFSQKNILKSFEKLDKKLIIYGDVKYRPSGERPKFTTHYSNNSFGVIRYVIDCVFTKYKVWSHEKERRFVIMSKDGFNSDFFDVRTKRERCFLGVKNSIDEMKAYLCECPNYVQLKKHPAKYELIDD